MNYMGHTQPARENPALQHAIEQGGYLAPSETQARFQARLTDSLANSNTSLLSTQNFSPARQDNSALPHISPHQPTFAHLPLTLLDQLKDHVTVSEEEHSREERELERRTASPRLIVLIRFLEKHGGPKSIPDDAISPVKDISITSLKGLYGEQIWALRNLFHLAPTLVLPCRNLSNLIKKAEMRPRSAPHQSIPSLDLFFQGFIAPTQHTKPNPLSTSLSLLLISLQEKSEQAFIHLQTLKKITHKLTPLFTEEKTTLNQQNLLLLFTLTGALHFSFGHLSEALDAEERAKNAALAGFFTGIASQLTKMLYEAVQKEPLEIRTPLQITAILTGIFQLLLAAPYFENIGPKLIRNSFPITQTALFYDSTLAITKTANRQPELVRLLQKCHEISEKEGNARDILIKLETQLLSFFELEKAELKEDEEASSSFVKELMLLYEFV